MKIFQITLPIFLSIWYLIIITPLSAQKAMNIMVKLDSVSRCSYDCMITKYKLSTCKYLVKNNTMNCITNPRVTIIVGIAKRKYGISMKDFREMGILLEPVGERGSSLLSYQYDDPGRHNDNWLYLPALGKVKRIVYSNDGSSSIFGSEYTVEDQQLRKIADYTYELLKEETYKNRPVWIIELNPITKRLKETKLGKIIYWIDKERYIVMREDQYDHHGRLYKQNLRTNIEQVDGVWTPRSGRMTNFLSNRVNLIDVLSIAYNKEVSDEFLSQRTMTDFAYKEKNMAKFRDYWKEQ